MIRTSAWVFIFKLLVATINFLTVILISRWLGPHERGVCSWYIVIIALSLVFSDMVAGPAAGFLLKKHVLKRVRLTSYLWAVIVSIIVTLILFVSGKINSAEFLLLAVLCWLNSANSIHLHLLLARQNFKWFNALSLLNPLVTLVFLLLFFYAGNTSRLFYLYSLLITWSFTFIAGCIKTNDAEESSNVPSYSELVREGFANGIANQLSHLAGLVNNRLVYFLLPATALGVYSNALSMAEASLMIPGSFGQVMYAKALQVEKISTRPLKNGVFISAVFLSTAFLLVLVIPDAFYQLIFGPAFSGVSAFLKPLLFFMIFYSGYLVTSYWQSAHGEFFKNFYANLAGLLTNILITIGLLGAGYYSLMTAIYALGAGFVTMGLVSLFLVLKGLQGRHAGEIIKGA
jgi:O-antigen/teichoic acid export membrane protein